MAADIPAGPGGTAADAPADPGTEVTDGQDAQLTDGQDTQLTDSQDTEPTGRQGTQLTDGDLVRLARDGDPVALRLLVERHQPMVRARAARLCGNPSDVDDVVQESFLQALIAMDGLRDPDRFAAWLAGVVHNVCRNMWRRRRLALVPDWPEPLHPATAGLPSAEDLDRAEALHAAVAALPPGQRHAVTLHYYAGLPAGEIAEPASAARASLHKARLRLRAYITEHRPDLVPAASGRAHMTIVRITSVERRVPPGPLPIGRPTDVVVLGDEASSRELPFWLLGQDGGRLLRLTAPAAESGEPAGAVAARTEDELTSRLLRAAGATVTGVDIDDAGPGVTVARIGIASPVGAHHVTARIGEGLAVAAAAGAPIRVSDAVMDRLAVPIGSTRPGPLPAPTAAVLQPATRPRYEPRNMRFADGLAGWMLGGSFAEHASQSHWHDYASVAENGVAVLSAAAPRPEGFAFLGQEMFADDYLGATVVFRGEFRLQYTPATGTARQAGLFLRFGRTRDIGFGRDIRGPVTEEAALADPSNHIVAIAATSDWEWLEETERIPDDCTTIVFGIFLAGPGRVELRNAELSRVT
jgi:RNA polymerase sigma-70 factor, ECF subfamily